MHLISSVVTPGCRLALLRHSYFRFRLEWACRWHRTGHPSISRWSLSRRRHDSWKMDFHPTSAAM